MFYLTLNTQKLVCATLLLSASLISPLHAKGEANESCLNAASLFNEGDLEGALEEARWCVTQLEQLKQGQTSSFFKDEIDGYVAGQLESQQVMGLSVINRSYTKGNNSVQVSLSAGESGAANNAFAAIASFGMQAMQGNKIRIQKRTANVTNDGGSTQVIVTLKSGGMLTFESRELSEDALVGFAESFPISELDDARG
jgi:hypothetical protein